MNLQVRWLAFGKAGEGQAAERVKRVMGCRARPEGIGFWGLGFRGLGLQV